MYVPLNDLRNSLRLVESLIDLDDPGGFAGIALPGLALLVGCDSLSFTVLGGQQGQVSVTRYPDGTASHGSMAAFAAYVHEHPLVNHYRETGDAQPIMISDFLSRRDFHRLNLYGEYFRRIPVEHQIAFGLPFAGPELAGIALNRAQHEFTEDERALLSVIRFPLVTALQRAGKRKRAREGLATATSGTVADLTDREIGVLRLAALGRTNSAIARALDISPRTVAKHLEHIYRKLDVNGRTSAAVLAALTDGVQGKRTSARVSGSRHQSRCATARLSGAGTRGANGRG
jgi:DNA-binding CsgD family transcriptional regulator